MDKGGNHEATSSAEEHVSQHGLNSMVDIGNIQSHKNRSAVMQEKPLGIQNQFAVLSSLESLQRNYELIMVMRTDQELEVACSCLLGSESESSEEESEEVDDIFDDPLLLLKLSEEAKQQMQVMEEVKPVHLENAMSNHLLPSAGSCVLVLPQQVMVLEPLILGREVSKTSDRVFPKPDKEKRKHIIGARAQAQPLQGSRSRIHRLMILYRRSQFQLVREKHKDLLLVCNQLPAYSLM